MIQPSSSDDTGDDVDENSAGHSNPSGSDSRRTITTEREPREARDEQSIAIEQHVPRRILRKTSPLYEAQAAQGRYFVHELTLEASSRMKCAVKIMAMPGTRASGLVHIRAGCVCQLERANDIGVQLQSKCTGTHRQPNRERGTNGVMGSPGRSGNGGIERGSTGVEDA